MASASGDGGRDSTAAAAAHDWPTVLAISIVAYVGAKVAHEALGHGLVCEAVGGDLLAVSSSWAACDTAQIGAWGNRAVKVGGTLANLLAGAAFFAALRRAPRSGATYYFVWLSAAVQLLVGGGYLMVDPLFRFGDWGRFLDGLSPAAAWRFGLSASGAALSLTTFFALRAPLQALLRGSRSAQRRQAFLLCWLPYFAAGGVVLTGAALLNSLGPAYAATSALATLGGTFLVVWLPSAVGSAGPANPGGREVRRSRAWLTAGAVALAFLVAFFGPGIPT